MACVRSSRHGGAHVLGGGRGSSVGIVQVRTDNALSGHEKIQDFRLEFPAPVALELPCPDLLKLLGPDLVQKPRHSPIRTLHGTLHHHHRPPIAPLT
jgi:hypothetical protein